MERSKGLCRGNKAKISVTHSNSELYALGTKTVRDDKSKVFSLKASSTTDRKREASSSHSYSHKKPKSNFDSYSLNFSDELLSTHNVVDFWEQKNNESDPLEHITSSFSYIVNFESAVTISTLCCTVKLLLQSSVRVKADNILYIFFIYLAKVRPDLFCDELITNLLVSTLRRDVVHKLKAKLNHTQILASNALYRGYADKMDWPETFLKCYIDDAVNERLWADNELCALFTTNICYCFGTRVPSETVFPANSTNSSICNFPHLDEPLKGDENHDYIVRYVECSNMVNINFGDHYMRHSLKNRYLTSGSVETYVTDAIKEHLNKRQSQDCYTRNFLKFLCSTSGLAEVRFLSISRLELWIHNGKLMKAAQELFSYICFNISSLAKDQEILSILVKMRLKTKPLINFYMACLKEIIALRSSILPIILKLVLQNELSNARNPNNMGILATLFQAAPEQSARNLADIYKEFLLQKEDCLRTLRVFLRELVRILRFDINIVEFCKVLLNGRPELTSQIKQSEYKDRIFHSTVDITCLCMILAVSTQVRETYISQRSGRETKNSQVLHHFYLQVSQIQLDAVSWMYAIVPNVYRIHPLDFSQALNKLLLLESPEQYSRCDQWPSEPERSTLLRIVSETPIYEDTLLRIILIGITHDIPFTISETFEVLVSVIKRASSLRNTDMPAVHANKFEIIDFLFSMAEYHCPEKIKLPDNYDPPKLAITVLYWKAWTIMLMISAHNPSTFGAFCWDHYPTMKVLMEMCITNQSRDCIKAKEELQISIMEREQIIEFETYLAAQTLQAVITEENAVLISQLMLMDPMGPARRVPSAVLDQLKHLNKTLKLGHLLCRSRKPDLLLEIINRQGTTQSMPWLSDLVQNSDGEFRHLPVQCLCEFLLSNVHILSEENIRDAKLLSYLRKLIMEENSDKASVCELLDYIFRRLSSTVKQSRIAAYAVLKLLLRDDVNWLLLSLPQIPYFKDASSFIITQLRSACQVENKPEVVMCYIQFIAAHTQNDPVSVMLDHVMDMAQLIVERNTMFLHITSIPLQSQIVTASIFNDLNSRREETLKCLFVMFNNYIIKLRDHQEPYEWTHYPDLLMVQFEDGIQLPIHLNIIHAFVILLTHSRTTIPESIPILDYWFPLGRSKPNAYAPDSPNDRVQLLPDWLKLKMIRSSVERLIGAALSELMPDQIVLFVQNFGTPVASMSKLLALLDHAVIEQFETVKNAILNRAYLAQLIEIQQGRGAKNGHITVHALELHSHSQAVPDLHRLMIDKKEYIDFIQILPEMGLQKYTIITNETDNNDFDNIMNTFSINKSNLLKFRKLIHQMCSFERNAKDCYINRTHQANVYLMCLVENVKTVKSLQYRFNKHVYTLLRTLLMNPRKTLELALLNDLNEIIRSANKTDISENDKLLPVFQKKINLFLKSTDQNNQALLKINNQQYSCLNLIHESCETKSTKKMFHEIISSIQMNAINPRGLVNNCAKYIQYGILIDWLVKVDPELILVNKPLQMNLMFSKTNTDFRFYLLSLLCHETNWNTLNETVNYLLCKFRSDFNQSAILNFIEALLNNPKLWKGRDKSISKNCKTDTIWVLDSRNIEVLTQYILVESELDSLLEHIKHCDRLSSRIDLLYQVSNKNPSIFINCLVFALKYPCSTSLTLKFIQQLYMMHPKIKFVRDTFTDAFISKLEHLNGFRFDRVANYLITCSGNICSKKDFDTIFGDLELLMRKLAASHPALFLRQLGALCLQIQGKAHMSIRALRDEHHIQRFIHLLRTFEFLQPMLFCDDYKLSLQSCLDCYFTFFKYHGREKETHQLVIKFVELLHAYIKKNPSSAFIYIEKYTFILQELATKFNFLITLQQLVQGISLLKHKSVILSRLEGEELKQEFDLYEPFDVKNVSGVNLPLDAEVHEPGISLQLDIENKFTKTLVFPETQKQAFKVSSNVLNLIQTIKRSSTDEIILCALQELESLTSKRFSFLHELFDRLLDLIFSSTAQIRSNAYILLIRHLKNQPGRSDVIRCTLNAFIQCLCDDNSSVASTAIENLVEMVVLLQEYSVEILGVAFLLGIKSRISTSAHIRRAIQALMLQHGY